MSITTLGRVGGELCECFAYLNSPAAIEGEIRHLQHAIDAGDRSPATAQLLADWQAIRTTQARLVGGVAQQVALDLEGGR